MGLRTEKRIALIRRLGDKECPTSAPCECCGQVEFVCCDRKNKTYGLPEEGDEAIEKDENGMVGTMHMNPCCIVCCTGIHH